MLRFRNEENVIRETRRQQTIETNKTQIENDMLRNLADALSNGADAGRVIAQVDRVKELLDQGKLEEANYVVEQIYRRATVVGPDGELRYDGPSINRVPAINNRPANKMVPESLSGNHEPPAATRVESPSSSTQTASPGVAPPAAIRMNVNPERSAVLLERQSRAAAEASRPPTPNVNVINNSQSQQQSVQSGSTSTTIDPNNPGPTEPADSGSRYAMLFEMGMAA
jgi:hypothetical protein